MAIWRSAEVEAILGCRLDGAELDEAALRRLIDAKTPETDQIEFKGRYAKGSGQVGWSVEQEFAKDVSALANHRGGVLFVGLTEKAGCAEDFAPPVTGSTAEKEERRLLTALANHMAPLAVVEVIPVGISAGGFVLVVVVPPSVRSPHAVVAKSNSENRGALRYPVRHGSDTRWLGESEVAERYARRIRSNELDVARLATVVRQGTDALRLAGSLWLYIAIVPEIPVQERIDRETVFANQRWVGAQSVQTPLGERIFEGLQTMAAPGRTILGRQWDAVDPIMKPEDVHIELHADGSVFLATEILPRTDLDAPSTGARAVGLQTLTRDVIPLVELGGRWVSRQAAVPGSARTQAGFYDAGGADGELRKATELHSVDVFSGMKRIPNTRRISEVRPTVETVYDLSEPLQSRGAVMVSSVILDGLLQWFGLADCPFLKRDGTILIQPWRPDSHERVRAWAKDRSVSII